MDESDLTGRARIRNAALAEFADKGESASLRGIARRAGVSAALVQHHFGTKGGLRQACDDHVLAYLRARVADGLDEGGIADPAYVERLSQDSQPVLRYLVRALAETTPSASRLFDELCDLTVPYLRGDDTVPARDRAAVLVAMKLGTLVLSGHLARQFGAPPYSPDVVRRTGAAMLDLLNTTFASQDVLALARQATHSEETR